MRHIVNLALFTVIHVVYNTHLNVCLLQLYRRTGDTKECDSSGFEHVFVGETRGEKEVIGFHNWIQFYLQEKAGHVDYQGYILGTKVCGTSPLPQFHEDYVLHCSLKREQSLTCWLSNSSGRNRYVDLHFYSHDAWCIEPCIVHLPCVLQQYNIVVGTRVSNFSPWAVSVCHNFSHNFGPWAASVGHNFSPWAVSVGHNFSPWTVSVCHNFSPWAVYIWYIISHISHTAIQQVKPIGSSFIGTSPEFELALYTILYFCSADRHTDVTIAGQDVVLACFKMGRHGLGTCHPKLPKD